MKIGKITEELNNGQKELWGHIQTMQLELEFRMLPMSDRPSPNSPDYIIVGKNQKGGWVEIGGAWEKTPKGHGMGGEPFLSITIDDPSFEQGLNVAAFTNDGKTWDVTWRRRQNSATPEAA